MLEVRRQRVKGPLRGPLWLLMKTALSTRSIQMVGMDGWIRGVVVLDAWVICRMQTAQLVVRSHVMSVQAAGRVGEMNAFF